MVSCCVTIVIVMKIFLIDLIGETCLLNTVQKSLELPCFDVYVYLLGYKLSQR